MAAFFHFLLVAFAANSLISVKCSEKPGASADKSGGKVEPSPSPSFPPYTLRMATEEELKSPLPPKSLHRRFRTLAQHEKNMTELRGLLNESRRNKEKEATKTEASTNTPLIK